MRWTVAALLSGLCFGCITDPDESNTSNMSADAGADSGGAGPDRSVPEPDRSVSEPEPEPEPQPGNEPPPAPESPFKYLLIYDDDSPDDGVGTTGVDICGVSADCALAIEATLTLGGGTICMEEGPGCLNDRASANALLDDGSSCDVTANPSDFASLGTSGSAAVLFNGPLAGCTVTVVEFAGATREAWEAFVCDSDDVTVANCLNNDEPVHVAPAGGTATFVVPAE